MLFQAFSDLDLQDYKPIGMRCDLQFLLLISEIFRFLTPTDFLNNWLVSGQW